MKKSKLFGWAFIALASLSACTDNAGDVLAGENEIRLTSEIAPSRVTSLDYQSTQIVPGQEVGITITGAKAAHKNVAWRVGEDGMLTNTGDPVFWANEDVVITAYHPYNSAWTGTSHEFSVSTDQSDNANYRNSDLLWAMTTSSMTKNAIPLVFEHKLAKVNVTLRSEDIDDLSGAVISICGTNVTTSFNPTTGSLSATATDVQEIKAGETTSSAYTASAIVVPQTVANGTKFIKIVLGDKTFYYTLSTDKELRAGYSHNYTLTIKDMEVTAESDKITDWEDDDNEGDLFPSEKEEDCSVYVCFKYDMNMEFSNAFHQAVNSVTLYVFDEDGKLVFFRTEEGEMLKQDGYRMRLDGISSIEASAYDYITWAGVSDNESFSIPELTVGTHTKNDLICQLNRAGDGIVDYNLDDLFHGLVSNPIMNRNAQYEYEIIMPLVKNTNSIRIMLAHVGGEPIEVDDYLFYVTDKNGKMQYDNTLMEDEQLTYKAWYTGERYAEMTVSSRDVITEINVAIAELATARLMEDMDPILTVTKADGTLVLRIPLVECALMFKRAEYDNPSSKKQMTDQEFLDREDEYNFMFFLDEYDNWISSSIIINDWKLTSF